MLQDLEQKIARPRQIYIGNEAREFVPIERRGMLPAPAGL
jgi:citrate synthase